MAPYMTTGVQVVMDRVNASGGLLGRQVQLIIRDDFADPNQISQQAAALKSDGVVGIVGPFLDSCSASLRAWTAQNRVLSVAPADTILNNRTTNYNKYMFFQAPISMVNGKVFAQNIAQQNDVASVYFIGSDVQIAHDILDSFWAEMQKDKPSVVDLGTIYTSATETNFVNPINAILAKKPDLTIVLVGGPSWPAFIAQAAGFDFFNQSKVATALNLDGYSADPFGHDYPVGIQAEMTAPYWLDSPEMRSFTWEFNARTGKWPAELTMDYYMATLALIKAIQKAGSINTDEVINAWETLTLTGTPLGTISYNDYDHQADTPIWYGTSAISPDWPLAIATNMVKTGIEYYPTRDEILALRGMITISVLLQGSTRPAAGWDVPLTVKFFTPGPTTPINVLTAVPDYIFNLTTTQNGSLASAQVTGITPGTYDISVVSPGCLTNVRRGVVITAPATDIDLGTLLEGNANEDHKISIQDFGILAAAYGKGTGETGYDARADFDRSGRVNIADFGLLVTNYARISPVEVP
jgi:branched-chain amino acid transport system substrate-binding protein